VGLLRDVKQVICSVTISLGLWAGALGLAHAAAQPQATQAPLATAAPSSDELYTAATPDHLSASISSTPLSKPTLDASTDAQIAGWISSEAGGDDQKPPGGPQQAGPRAIHGEMGVAVGSNGYRNVYGVTDIPIGQNSDLGLAASNSSYNGRHGYGGGSQTSLGISLRLGDPAGSPSTVCGMTRSVWLPTDDQVAANCAARSSSY
jgi:hypothetical protein